IAHQHFVHIVFDAQYAHDESSGGRLGGREGAESYRDGALLSVYRRLGTEKMGRNFPSEHWRMRCAFRRC
ncbi:hypothetical protein ACXYUI_34420, partial [Klebsiella pneumoniae]